MIPKELKPYFGLNRVDRIRHADQLLRQANAMVVAAEKDGFAQFADDFCDTCTSADECGLRNYHKLVDDAVEAYAAAGLGHLAGLVREIVRPAISINDWIDFDEACVNTEV